MVYSLPAFADGVNNLAYHTHLTVRTMVVQGAFGITYTGIEGLTVKFGSAEDNSTARCRTVDQTVMGLSYAYGPITARCIKF